MEMTTAWILISALIKGFAIVIANFGIVYWIFRFFLWLLKLA